MGSQSAADLNLEAECRTLFPAPGWIEQVWLYSALLQIIERVHWLTPLLGGERLSHSVSVLRARTVAATPDDQLDADVTPLRGTAYGRAGAMIGQGVTDPPKGLLTLRGLYWLVLRRWYTEGELRRTAANDLGAALRMLVAAPTSKAAQALYPVLSVLDGAENLAEAAAALDKLVPDVHTRLELAWSVHLRPTLEEILADNKVEPRPTGDPGPNPEELSGANTSEDPGLGTDTTVEAHPLWRRKPFPGQLPHEPPDEFGTPVRLVMVQGYGTGGITRRQALYKAGQAIWSSNQLLLPSHHEALMPDVYGSAVRWLVGRLEQRDLTAEQALGYLLCLVKATTGRTTRSMRALQLGVPADDAAATGICLDLDNGFFHFAPLWKMAGKSPSSGGAETSSSIGYFRPNDTQADWLEPVSDRLILPLTRPIHRVCRQWQQILAKIAAADPAALDASAADAATQLSSELTISISAASLRRSLGPLVVEATGDVAMAQLICGDNFGQSSAPQHYYAPRQKDIAAAYAQVVGGNFDESSATSIKASGTRIGSELLVKVAVAKRLAKASKCHVPTTPLMTDVASRLATNHRRLVVHLAWMFLTAAGHRWAESLFQMTLNDMDLDTGLVLFGDKRIDVAHAPRIACLPRVVCQQLEVYIGHLCRLVDVLPARGCDLTDVLMGDAPLLVDLAPEGLRGLTLGDLTAMSHPDWSVLPHNWGRTYIRTYGIERGADPFLISCQLGHYDVIGEPFSNQSPTEPIEFALKVQPELDKIAKSQAWEVLCFRDQDKPKRGRRSRASWRRILPPLKDWEPEIKQVERAHLKEHKQWEQSLRRNSIRLREQALGMVLAHPVLVRSGVTIAYQQSNIGGGGVTTLADDEMCLVRSGLVASCGDDLPLAAATIRALRRVVRDVAKRTGVTLPPVPKPLPFRRPVDNAVFAGSCLALTQVRRLREHIAERSDSGIGGRSFAAQVARAAETLALFGRITDPDLLLSILAARGAARPSHTLHDLLLVPLPDGRVVELRGLGALVVAHLSSAFPDEPLPSHEQIATHLERFLPAWAVGPEGQLTLLARLCSTAAVANRYELSPAARFAADPDGGSVSATVPEQLALIDRDPVGPTRVGSAGSDHVDARRGTLQPAQPVSTPRAQYNALCRMIPTSGSDLELPLTNKLVPATGINHISTRMAVLDEFDVWLAEQAEGGRHVLYPGLQMLGHWARSELWRKKDNGDFLANSTVKTYVTRIGGAMVEFLGASGPEDWDESTFESAYDYTFEFSIDARYKVAAALLSFHRHSERIYDLPEVDLSRVYSELKHERQHPDSALILPVERDKALAQLRHRAWEDMSRDFPSTRIARLADSVAYFLAYAGARLREPLGLQVRDLGLQPDGWVQARLRPNRSRRLKSRAGSRVLSCCDAADRRHNDRVWRWREDVRIHARSQRPESAFLVADIDTGKHMDEHGAVAQAIRDALANATGRPTERLHRLRHLVANERLLDTVLSERDSRVMERQLRVPGEDRVLRPRDLFAVSIPMGHGHWRTTIQCYCHLLWILRSRSDARDIDTYFSARYIAGVLGYKRSTIDSIWRGVRPEDYVRACFDHWRPARNPTTTRADEGVDLSTVALSWQWTATRVSELAEHAWRTQDLETALRLMGAPLASVDVITREAERWEYMLGLRLIPAYVWGQARQCPRRAVRRMTEDAVLERLCHEMDNGSVARRETIRAIIADCRIYLRPTHRHELALSKRQAAALARLLIHLGVAENRIDTTPLSGDLCEISIRRPVTSRRTHQRYRGLGLKRVVAVLGIATALQTVSA